MSNSLANDQLLDDSAPVWRSHNRILLIEDDPAYVHLCKRYLHSDSDNQYVVIAATCTVEALAVAQVDSFDCFVVDYRLGQDLGTDLVLQLQDILGDAMPSVIVMTAEQSDAAPVDAIRTGANDFMRKDELTKSSLCRAVGNAVEKGQLRKANVQRMKELETANKLLRRRNEEIQRFYHTVSHEVKTPLTAIQEFVSIVYDGLAGELLDQQKTILEYALESCDQIKNQFDDLLELSKFETGKMVVSLSAGSIYEVFDHCVVAATPAAADKGISLDILDQPGLPKAMMQRDRVIQVLSNLINNAIKFTDAGGSVLVGCELSADASTLKLSVSDTGCGIPPANLKHIFDRLYQVTPSSERANETGLGLGLSIASEIIKLHGSEIKVESTLGKGSHFSFNLNVADLDELDNSGRTPIGQHAA